MTELIDLKFDNKELQIEYYGKSLKGSKELNEDNFIIEDSLFAVADGVSQGGGGYYASFLATSALSSIIKSNFFDEENYSQFIKKMFVFFNKSINFWKNEKKEIQYMATTLSFLLIKNENIYISSIGDSRVYKFENNKLNMLTTDHIVSNTYSANQQDNLSESDKKSLSYFLGDHEKFVQPTILRMNINELNLPSYFILCTDGINKAMTDKELEELINNKHEKPVKTLTDEIINICSNRPDKDDKTIIILKISNKSFSDNDKNNTLLMKEFENSIKQDQNISNNNSNKEKERTKKTSSNVSNDIILQKIYITIYINIILFILLLVNFLVVLNK